MSLACNIGFVLRSNMSGDSCKIFKLRLNFINTAAVVLYGRQHGKADGFSSGTCTTGSLSMLPAMQTILIRKLQQQNSTDMASSASYLLGSRPQLWFFGDSITVNGVH